MNREVTLDRALSLPMVTLYGLGTTLGAGIYVLVGKVAGAAGSLAPLSFLLASALAALSALSFAELSSRYPKSAGPAVYVFKGFGAQGLSTFVGFLVIFSGVVSAATIANGFVGYLDSFVVVPPLVAVTALVLLLGVVAGLGIKQSVGTAAVLTLIEIAGLVWIIYGASDEVAAALSERTLFEPASGFASGFPGVVSGAVLAFYAYIGFEDMVNVAEEVRSVERTLPRAIILTLVVTTLLYVLVILAAMAAIPTQDLSASEAPLALVFERTTNAPPSLISAIAMLAVVNGALIQIIMGARMLYGLSRENWLSPAFAKVNARTRTPLLATGCVTALVLLFALLLPLTALAKMTSMLILTVFALVNLALYRIRRGGPSPTDGFRIPLWVPAVGCVTSAIFAVICLVDLLRV